MAEHPNPAQGSNRRRRFASFKLVHSFQRKYAYGLALLLFTYSLIPFGLAFLSSFVGPSITLLSAVPPEEQALAASQILALGQVALPALVILIVGAAVYSFYVTNRIAGPIYRLQQSVKELATGNLTLRIRFRQSDELHELADLTNQALANIEQALVEIRSRGAHGREALHQALKGIRAQPSPNQEQLSQLESALKDIDHVDEVLRRFRLSNPG